MPLFAQTLVPTTKLRDGFVLPKSIDMLPNDSGFVLPKRTDNQIPKRPGRCSLVSRCQKLPSLPHSINLSARFRSSHQSEFGGFVLPNDTGYYIAGLYTAPPSDHVCASVTGSFFESLATNPEAAHMRAARACMAICPERLNQIAHSLTSFHDHSDAVDNREHD
jgi:hypothetical protein